MEKNTSAVIGRYLAALQLRPVAAVQQQRMDGMEGDGKIWGNKMQCNRNHHHRHWTRLNYKRNPVGSSPYTHTTPSNLLLRTCVWAPFQEILNSGSGPLKSFGWTVCWAVYPRAHEPTSPSTLLRPNGAPTPTVPTSQALHFTTGTEYYPTL